MVRTSFLRGRLTAYQLVARGVLGQRSAGYTGVTELWHLLDRLLDGVKLGSFVGLGFK